MKNFFKYILLTAVFTFLLFCSSLFTSYAETDLGTHSTGLKEPTQQEADWMKNYFKPVKRVKLNSIGKQRVLDAAKKKKKQQKILNEINKIKAVPIGQEADFTSTGSSLLSNDIAGANSLVDSVDNSQSAYFPPIANQGRQGSCTAFATTYYQFTYMNAFARKEPVNKDNSKIFSPKWTYNFANGGADMGSCFSTIYDIILTNGAATWKDIPYDGSNYREWPTNADVWRNAINYRIDTMGSVDSLNTDTGLSKLKDYLKNGYILTFGTYVNSWIFTQAKDDPSTDSDNAYIGKKVYYCVNGTNGAHAMTIVGYNDNIWIDLNNNGIIDSGEKGAFKIANSWGTTNSWGEGGFGWLSYNAVKKGAIFNNQAYWITVKSSYTPKLLAEFTINTEDRSLFNIDLKNSNKVWRPYLFDNSRQYPFSKYSFNGTTTACDGNFVLDYTDLINQNKTDLGTTSNYYFNITCASKTLQKKPILKSFKLVNPQNGDIVSCVNPFPVDCYSGNNIFLTEYPRNSANLPPTTVSFLPNSSSNNIPTKSNVILSFNKIAKPSSNKNIYIKKWADNSIFTTILANDTSQVSISNNVVTINPLIDLNYDTKYYINIDKGAFIDSVNNGSMEINDKNTWYFTTASENISAPKLYGESPLVDSTSGSLYIYWSIPSDARGYKIYRSPSISGTYNHIGTSYTNGNNAYTDTGLSANTTYYYKVSAINAEGVESEKSNGIGATTKPITPTDVTIIATSSSLTLNWKAVDGVNGYKVYKSTDSGKTFSCCTPNPINTTIYIDGGLQANTGYYYYKVSAISAGGIESEKSLYVLSKTLLTPPTGLHIENAVSNALTLNWDAINGADEYSIYKSTNLNGLYNWVGTFKTTSYTDKNLLPSTTYYYKINYNSKTPSFNFSDYSSPIQGNRHNKANSKCRS